MKLRKNTKFSSKVESLSKSSEKKGDLLIQVNELMEKLENDYGPLMLGELQKRLKKTIEDFHDDVNVVLKIPGFQTKLIHLGIMKCITYLQKNRIFQSIRRWFNNDNRYLSIMFLEDYLHRILKLLKTNFEQSTMEI